MRAFSYHAPMSESFFERDGDRFVATLMTRGPWSAEHQHGGPPARLMTRAVEKEIEGLAVARMTCEFLKPIPIARLSLKTSVLRPGKKVRILGASLATDDGTEVARASFLCIRTTKLSLAEPRVDPAPKPVAESEPYVFTFFQYEQGYHKAMEMRIARGTFGHGAMAAWMRMRVPLVPGETPSPFVRTVVAADSGNGVSVALDPAKWTFINPDLTVHVHRQPHGEWVCLDAQTIAQPHGIGLAQCTLYDEKGAIGRSLQSLLVDSR